jgi:signal transduction histidine kinase
MKLHYKQRLFLYIAFVFTIFTVCLTLFERSREKAFRTDALIKKLDAYSEMVRAALTDGDNRERALDDVGRLLPQNIRLSLIDRQGNVLFDNTVGNLSGMENHASRPEVKQALTQGTGTDIRNSASNQEKYLYYAKKFGDRYIRVALPYDIQTQRLLKPDNLFLYYILALFVVVLILMNAITNRFGKSIRQLRDFATLPVSEDLPAFSFPDDELGEIGQRITANYLQMKENERIIGMEREKLLQHVHSSEEGICFFNTDRKPEFNNGLFIRYLNTLTEVAGSDPSIIFRDRTFQEIDRFLSEKNAGYFETQIRKHGKMFSLRVNFFEDNSFEIILNDVTEQEKNRLLKQEITGNVAHELRTPVTGIRCYLETVLTQPMEEERKRYFVTRAYHQTITLSELISDMSLITKIEAAPHAFGLEAVNLPDLLETLRNDLSLPLREKNIRMQWNIDDHLHLNGNRNLLYAIFRNLADNTIRYAGENTMIQIDLYNEDNDFYYFSYRDTGVGIPDESHLTRLFERFYRITEGRTRDTGGSGLGLSIVKNAVAFHKGTIIAKNRVEGGLEFLFQLHK